VKNIDLKKFKMKNKSVLLSRTHCQAAQSNAKTKAWQRVCLSNRTTKPTDKPADEKEHRSDNISNRCTTTFLKKN
jgi:hypothetical protein